MKKREIYNRKSIALQLHVWPRTNTAITARQSATVTLFHLQSASISTPTPIRLSDWKNIVATRKLCCIVKHYYALSNIYNHCVTNVLIKPTAHALVVASATNSKPSITRANIIIMWRLNYEVTSFVAALA